MLGSILFKFGILAKSNILNSIFNGLGNQLINVPVLVGNSCKPWGVIMCKDTKRKAWYLCTDFNYSMICFNEVLTSITV